MPDIRPDAIRSPKGSTFLPFTIVGRPSLSSDLYGCPTLVLYLGRDAQSSGVSVSLRTPSGGRYARYETLMAERWQMPIASAEDAVCIAIQALESLLGKMRGLQ